MQRKALNMQIGSIKFMSCHFKREMQWAKTTLNAAAVSAVTSMEIKINDV